MWADAPARRLRVTAAVPTAELFVVDSRFEIARDAETEREARGIGTLNVALAPGAYRVKAKIGAHAVDRLIALTNADCDVSFPAYELVVESATPLGESPDAIEVCWQAIERIANRVNRRSGVSQLAVLVRSNAKVDPPEAIWLRKDRKPPERFETWTGPQRTHDGWITEVYRDQVVRALAWELPPGTYRLGIRQHHGEVSERTVPLYRGRTTQVFMVAGADGLLEDHLTSVLLGTPLGHSTVREDELRLAETARTQLAALRIGASKALMDDLLHMKFEEPMLGLYAVHLLRLAGSELELIDAVLNNLDHLVPGLPDVTLLKAWRTGQPLDTPLSPPLLRASWDLFLEESYRNQGWWESRGARSLNRYANTALAGSTWLRWTAKVPEVVREAEKPMLLAATRPQLATGQEEFAIAACDARAEKPAPQPLFEPDLRASLSGFEQAVIDHVLRQLERSTKNPSLEDLLGDVFRDARSEGDVFSRLSEHLDREDAAQLAYKYQVPKGELRRRVKRLAKKVWARVGLLAGTYE